MIITKTPLRISFAGGGTDLPDYYRVNGGAVVSAGINKYIYITVNPKFDNKIRVSYSNTEIVDEVQELNHELVRECLQMVGIHGGIEITSIADIPSGTGLGSSSTFTVGLLNALYSHVGERVSAHELAEKACEIEINVLKHPIGKQDQFAAAYGGMNYFEFHKDESVLQERIFLDDTNARKMRQKLVLFYTGMTRSADSVLQEQKKNTASRLEVLDEMKHQAEKMHHDLISEGFGESFASTLHQGWIYKQSLASTITNDQISQYYQAAMDAGAKGGKLLGAGGGGFLLFYCDEQNQEALEKAIGLRRVEFHVSLSGTRVIFNG
ncbi:MAG: GHMP kinase [Clostridiales bacterium]|nr:GHMP kinase [Clostridiales bacterium]